MTELYIEPDAEAELEQAAVRYEGRNLWPMPAEAEHRARIAEKRIAELEKKLARRKRK